MQAREDRAIRVLWMVIVLYAITYFMVGCAPARFRSVSVNGVTVSMHPAAPSQCPNGGTHIKVGGQATVICNGSNGAVGATGATGAQGQVGIGGSAGQVGATGPAGSPGTSVTIVSLCPGVTSYPGVFIEVALCIDKHLYGVYSANGGFMTYLPPGNYSSNAIGSACNLTVKPSCVVSH